MAMERQHRPIDKEFEECNYTGVLDVSGRNLRMFPHIGDELYDPLEVFTAVVSGNRFDKFPKLILTYINLASLNFYNNALRSVPADMIRLQQLKHLDLSKNFLSKLPSTICELHLERLSVNNNRLHSLPPEIGKMASLKYLDVSCNDLVDLPESFTDLQSLIQLNLRRNEIKELPADIFKIPLWHLDVSSNSLTRLPINLRLLHSLTEFYCSDNPLELPPAQICVRGLTHVFKYLTEMEKYGSDPQLFASNREESLMRRRRDKGKRNTRPLSNASTLSGEGSDYERSFLDEMSTIVQSAFGGGKDGNFLGRNESEPAGGKHWTQFRNYEDNMQSYRSGSGSGARYRSQSPGPVPGQSNSGQTTPTHTSNNSGHFGTLPRSGKDSGSLQISSGGRGLPDEPVRSGSFHNYGGSKRVSSPVYSGSSDVVNSPVLRTLSSENSVKKTPSNPDLSAYTNTSNEEKSYLSKRTELSNHPSTSNQYHNSPHHTKTMPSSSANVPLSTSSPKVTSDNSDSDNTATADVTMPLPSSNNADDSAQTDIQPSDDSNRSQSPDPRPPSPANSRDGSITPTPEDIDTDEPLTPNKLPEEELNVPNIVKLLEKHDFNFSAKWEEFGRELGVSLDVRQKVAADAHLSQDFQSALVHILKVWLADKPVPTWEGLLTALEGCEQSSIANSLRKNYVLSNEVGELPSSTDANSTPRHKVPERQVSFSVNVSEIPTNRASVSSEASDLDVEFTRSESVPRDDQEEIEDNENVSPLQSPRKGPQTAPKPRKKDVDNTNWAKKRAGGQPKRKGDVFKSIGKQDPNFTVRRMEVHMMEELEKIQDLKTELEAILMVPLSNDLGENISDGTLLCELVNRLHPNTISVIHRPKQGENISGPKKTMNIAAFIAACKKIGVPEALVCSAGDISEYKDPIRVCACLRGLLDTAVSV